MSEREQYGELADQLEDRADTLADENRRLGERIADVRGDWQRKREDPGVAGATPDWDDPDEDEDDDGEDEEDTEDGDADEDEEDTEDGDADEDEDAD
jgi:ribonuclease E